MSRGKWQKIKGEKSFYVKTYRLLLSVVVILQVLNVLFGLGIMYSRFHKPERTYYATSGIVPPVQLTARNTPNYSSNMLLPPDPVEGEVSKPVPE